MFRGIAAINLDEKWRLAIPTRYRAELKDCCEHKLIVTASSTDKCLLLYPLPEWEEVEKKLVKLPALDKKAIHLRRRMIGYASECEMDGQGRFLISEPLRKYAGIEKRTVLIGQGNKFEIWDEDFWNSSQEQWSQDEALNDLSALSSELETLSF